MSTEYPRSSKVRLAYIIQFGRIIDKNLIRHAGQIHDYNYLAVGFDR